MKTELYVFLAQYILVFALVLVRVGFLVAFLPVFGARMVPLSIKAALVLILSLILTPLVVGKVHVPETTWGFLLQTVPEALLGLSLAFLVRLILAGAQFSGQLLGFQMGFGVANVIDPATGVEAPVLSQMIYLFALLLFLIFDLHHYFFLALGESLKLFPPGSIETPREVFLILVERGEDIFRLALKLLAPVIAILLLVQLALGIVSRFVPQVNVMMISFPLTISLGLFFFGLTFELLGLVLRPAYEEAVRSLPFFIKAFGK